MKAYHFASIFLLLLLAACNTSTEEATVIRKDITESVYASGVVKAKGQSRIFAQVSGTLKQIVHTEGDDIRVGDTLFIIDYSKSNINKEIAALQYDLAQQEAAINSYKLQELETRLTIAKEQRSNDSIQYIRQKNLWDQNIGSKSQLDERKLKFENSKANQIALKQQLKDVNSQLQSNKNIASSKLQLSKEQLEDYIIRSTLNGQLFQVNIEEGELVNPNAPLGIIGRTDSFVLELQIDEYDIREILLGQTVLITMDSYSGEVYRGRISHIQPLMNDASRTFTVEADFTKSPVKLYPNLTAEANIVIQTKKDALLIPRSYLLSDSLVITAKEESTKVQTGLMNYEWVEIVEGLSEGQSIYKP